MRFVIVPDAVELVDHVTGNRIQRRLEDGSIVDEPPITMARCLITMVLGDTKFGKSYSTLVSAENVRLAFDKANPGDVVELEDEDHALLKLIIENPTNAYPTVIAVQYISFFKAIDEATSIRPKKDVG